MCRKPKPLQFIRQGDVTLIAPSHPSYRRPEGKLTAMRDQPTLDNRLVLAYGEATGHHHSVDRAVATISLDEGGVTYLTIAELTEVQHQEHGAAVIEPMAEPWQVVIPSEWTDAQEPRRVVD